MWSRSDYLQAFEVLQQLETQFRMLEPAMIERDKESLERTFRTAYSRVYHYKNPEEILQAIDMISDVLEKYSRRN